MSCDLGFNYDQDGIHRGKENQQNKWPKGDEVLYLFVLVWWGTGIEPTRLPLDTRWGVLDFKKIIITIFLNVF